MRGIFNQCNPIVKWASWKSTLTAFYQIAPKLSNECLALFPDQKIPQVPEEGVTESLKSWMACSFTCSFCSGLRDGLLFMGRGSGRWLRFLFNVKIDQLRENITFFFQIIMLEHKNKSQAIGELQQICQQQISMFLFSDKSIVSSQSEHALSVGCSTNIKLDKLIP